MTLDEGKKLKDILTRDILCYYSIIAFDKGKLDGRSYGNKISEAYGKECGERFIIQN